MRHTLSKDTHNYIRLRDEGICVYCKNAVGQQIDHVIPIKHRGPSIRSNLVLACEECNRRKKGSLEEVWLARAFKHLMEKGENLDWVDSF